MGSEWRREYRVIWKRQGKVEYRREYKTRKGAEIRYGKLTSTTPFVIHSYDEFTPPETLAPLEYARLESREVGGWISELGAVTRRGRMKDGE